MTVEIGTAKISTVLGNNIPLMGKAAAGTSNIASREDHTHPPLIALGVYVDGGKPALETTSTLCYIWVPSGSYLAWDDVNQVFTYG